MATYGVCGAQGQVGGQVARVLLGRGHGVRAILRAEAPGDLAGAVEIVTADLRDRACLARAFAGLDGAFVLNPPAYGGADLFHEARRVAASLAAAIRSAGLQRVVALSSVGAHLNAGTGNILTNHLLERELAGLAGTTVFVRAAWFIENAVPLLGAARSRKVFPSFLQPLDRALPSVSVRDVGRVCAAALADGGSAGGIVELEGPAPVAPADVARALAKLLRHDVTPRALPRDEWPGALAEMGIAGPAAAAWIEMVEGFNSGRIDFETAPAERAKGLVGLDEALRLAIEDRPG